MLKKFKMQEPNDTEGCFDVCDECMQREFAPGTQFCCVVCQKRRNNTWGNRNVSNIVASRHGLRFVAGPKIVLDVCSRCLWLQPRMSKKERSIFWFKKIKAKTLYNNQ
jgi:hypothetical protein